MTLSRFSAVVLTASVCLAVFSGSTGGATSPIAAVFWGTAHPVVPLGARGKLSIVATVVGADMHEVYVMVRNNSKRIYTNIGVSGPMFSSGQIAGAGSSQGLHPAVVVPGQVALGYVYFQDPIPTGATFKLTLSAEPGAHSGIRAVGIATANFVGPDDAGYLSLAGTTVNRGKVNVSAPIAVDVFCFSSGGQLLGVGGRDFASGPDPLPPKAQGSFEINLGRAMCPSFLVAASGFAF